jgi:hypothetical protein
MHPFEAYLKQHHLDALTVSLVAQVRYTTVWRATKGQPIQPESAKRIRQALIHYTGIPYYGPLTSTGPEPVEELPTMPIKRIPRHNLI